MACWAYLKDDSELLAIFPERNVPIRSIVPITPRERGCPLCYIVEGRSLSEEQLQYFGQRLFELWSPECTSREQAKEYILSEGLPLKTTHFGGVGTNDRFYMPHGAALNMAMRMQEMESQ